MKWCRIQTPNGPRFGAVEGKTIALIDGSPFGNHTRTGETLALDDARLLVPVVPGTFYAIGSNYRDHVVKMAEMRGREPVWYERPRVGYRANSALIPNGADIVKPADATEEFQYEAEIVAVIGKSGRNLSPAEAKELIFGWTIGNDVSERTWQRGDRTFWRGKNADTFKPMGPWIETDVDLDSMETTVRLNGEETIRFETNNMLFGIERYISAMTQYLTLYPGDVIWMGTEGKSPQMKHGDVCEIDITGIGTLSNPVVRES